MATYRLALVMGCWSLACCSFLLADETTDTAAWLLKRSVVTHRNGMHNVLLRSLRQMRDPALKPLFEHLANNPEESLAIHGILGLTELADPPQLNPNDILTVSNPAIQARLLTAVIDSDLLTVKHARTLWQSTKLAEQARIVLAAWLAGPQLLSQRQIKQLDQLLQNKNIAVQLRALGYLALIQMQVPNAENALENLLAEQPAHLKPRWRGLLWQTMIRYRYQHCAKWLNGIQKPMPAEDRYLPLYRVVRLMNHMPEADTQWRRWIDAMDYPAMRWRAAMEILELGNAVPIKTFDDLKKHKDPVLAMIGRLGLACHQPPVTTAVIQQAIQVDNPLIDRWILSQTRQLPNEDAQQICQALIQRVTKRTDRNPPPAIRIENGVLATQTLIELNANPEPTQWLLQQLQTQNALTQEMLLMGLIRSRRPMANLKLNHLQRWASPQARAMAVLLMARHQGPLDDSTMQELSMIVRGGSDLQMPLRIQAAWAYLKQTRNVQQAIQRALPEPASPAPTSKEPLTP